MKLIAALTERSELVKKVNGVNTQIQASAVIRNGRKPVDDPDKLMAAAISCSDGLASLIERIHRTNSTAKIADGRTIGKAMSDRMALLYKHSFLTQAVSSARGAMSGYDDKTGPSIDIGKYSKQVDDVAQALRKLNDMIQEANFKTDLLD